MKIHHTQIAYSPSGAGATGYGADNLAYAQVGRPWRSVDLTQHQLVLDMGSSKTPASVWLQGANVTSVTIEHSPDNVSYTSLGAMTLAMDRGGRYKGRTDIGAACRYVRLTVTVQTPTDGAAYYWIGAAYIYTTSEAAPTAPVYGMRLNWADPQERRDLPNGRSTAVTLGARYCEISGSLPAEDTADAARLLRLALEGTVGLDFQISAAPELAFPVSAYEGGISLTLDNPAIWPVDFTLKEVC